VTGIKRLKTRVQGQALVNMVLHLWVPQDTVFLDQVGDYHILKKDLAPWTW